MGGWKDRRVKKYKAKMFERSKDGRVISCKIGEGVEG